MNSIHTKTTFCRFSRHLFNILLDFSFPIGIIFGEKAFLKSFTRDRECLKNNRIEI